MVKAMVKATVAGTMMTTRNLRSMGRSANQRIKRPPGKEYTAGMPP
jgi:hypothetical protein